MIREMLKHNKKEFAGIALVELGWSGLLILSGRFIQQGEETVFPLAALYCYAFSIMLTTLLGIVRLQREFNLGISLGGTRRRVIGSYAAVQLLLNGMVGIIACVTERLERTYYQFRMPTRAYEDDLSVLFTAKGIVMVVFLATAMGLLVQSLILRFGNIAVWATVILFIGICVAPGKIAGSPAAAAAIGRVMEPISRICLQNHGIYGWLLWVLAVVCLGGISWGILRKQQVEQT